MASSLRMYKQRAMPEDFPRKTLDLMYHKDYYKEHENNIWLVECSVIY